MMFGLEITNVAYAISGLVFLIGAIMFIYLLVANKKDLVSSYTIEDAKEKVEVKTKNLYEEPEKKTFSFEESVVGAPVPPPPTSIPRPTIELPPAKLKPILKPPSYDTVSAPKPVSGPSPLKEPLTRKQIREQSSGLPLPRKDS